MSQLRREVLIPLPPYRRPSSLVGFGVVLVLLAGAVDAALWTQRVRRDAQARPAPAAIRIHRAKPEVEKLAAEVAAEIDQLKRERRYFFDAPGEDPAGRYGKMNHCDPTDTPPCGIK
jgi:hypothetical protein